MRKIKKGRKDPVPYDDDEYVENSQIKSKVFLRYSFLISRKNFFLRCGGLPYS